MFYLFIYLFTYSFIYLFIYIYLLSSPLSLLQTKTEKKLRIVQNDKSRAGYRRKPKAITAYPRQSIPSWSSYERILV